ncbi:RtcB family protein [Marinicella sediminis]|uniref:3'-phosphate/5'-hydroxy nucleic acid ligase n=1 Tax=Marinicella sediminis TaxID=1792834 RepID=A0ABV7JB39_9GAMM|nr:RtcB family protein [Marinicella sediminis]
MPIFKQINKTRVPVKIFTEDIAPQAIDQLVNIANLPIVHHHVAAMPDVHLGIGATVGSVIPTLNAVIPAAVGVDIGCGMNAVRTSLTASDLPDNLYQVRSRIESRVPVGFNWHKRSVVNRSTVNGLDKPLDELVGKHPAIMKMLKGFNHTWHRQLGTLGGGNHFIELCLDENDDVWIMLHSGSRGVGNVIGRYFINLAKKDMQRHQQHLPDTNLAYFSEGSQHFTDYVMAVNWAQEYAWVNRQEMMKLVVDALKASSLPNFTLTKKAINCHHNYISHETHYGERVIVTRKGAIRAGQDELGIIPGSMGARSYIVKGKGSAASFCSCAHGAGRTMSRTEAKRSFSVRDLEHQTSGVECRKDRGMLDEIPGAYKDIDQVMANQADLVDVVHTLKQVVCVKG